MLERAGIRIRCRICAPVIALGVAVAPTLAGAQSADRIEAIEKQIRRLEGDLQRLKGELTSTRQQLRQSQRETERARAQMNAAGAAMQAAAARPPVAPGTTVSDTGSSPGLITAPMPAAPGPKVMQTQANRFGLESADGRNSIYLTGRLHLDVADYLHYDPKSKFASVQNLNSGVNARRARLGVTGKFAGDWNYTLIYDFGGSSDGLPPTPGAPTTGIENAFITYNGFNKGPLPVAFDLGYLDVPWTLGESTSSNDILFVERPSIVNIASGIFANDFRSAAGVRSNNDRYLVSLYLTGPTSGTTHTSGEQMGVAGRAAYQLLQSSEYSLHIGGDAGALLKAPTATVGGLANVPSLTLSDRPELRVDPTAITSTGLLGTAANPVTGAQVYGVEAAAGWRNFFLQGEYYKVDLDRRSLGTNHFSGGYIESSWVISGERRKYIPATGAYSGIVPDHPLEPWMDHYGTGAWELVGRYSTVNLNDGVSGPLAVAGGYQNVYAVGLNWYPNTNIRFMFDFLHGDISKRFAAGAPSGGGIAGTPSGTPVGGSFDALVMRSQFAF